MGEQGTGNRGTETGDEREKSEWAEQRGENDGIVKDMWPGRSQPCTCVGEKWAWLGEIHALIH